MERVPIQDNSIMYINTSASFLRIRNTHGNNTRVEVMGYIGPRVGYMGLYSCCAGA